MCCLVRKSNKPFVPGGMCVPLVCVHVCITSEAHCGFSYHTRLSEHLNDILEQEVFHSMEKMLVI